MFSPYFYFVALGIVATIIIERLIGLKSNQYQPSLEYDILAAENDLLYMAVNTSNVQQIRELAASGRDINAPCDNGASVLFLAVLIANVEVIRTLLELGADPNFPAVEPALSVYADTPLDVAIQARLVMDWEKYNPIVQILIDYGATEQVY